MEETNCKNELLKRIANHLILNAGFAPNLGLYHGKMGIAIFFYHYARYTGNKTFDDFAGILLEQLYEDIHDKMYYDLEDGLCGIGWGIEYLTHKKFINGDLNDILADIDIKIMENDPLRLSDKNIRTGIGGILHYATYRLQNYSKLEKVVLFDQLYLDSLMTIAHQAAGQSEIRSIASQFEHCIAKKRTSYKPEKFLSQINTCKREDNDITTWGLGIENGCAGAGLKIMGI